MQALCPSRQALVKLHTMSLLHPQPFRLWHLAAMSPGSLNQWAMVMGWLIQVLITQARTSAQSPVDIAIVQERNPVLCLRKYFGIPLKTPSLKVLVLALMIMADYMSRGSATGQTFTSVKPSSPSNVRAQPFSQSWRGVLAFSKFFGGRKLKFNKMLPRPQNAVFSPLWVQVPSRVKVYQSVMAPSRGYQPIFHNPHPSRYIVRSRSSYQRGRYVQSKTRYTPDYPPNGMEGVERPAQS